MKTKATERLIAILQDGIDVHRCAAARALGVIGQDPSTQALVKALLDEDGDVRTDAAMALAEINNPETAEKLMENLLGDPEAGVKRAAIEALVAMDYQPLVPVLRRLAVTRSDDLIAWDEDEFYTEGWDSWVDIQMAAIEGLGVFAPEDAVDDIITAMNDEMGQDLSEPGLRALARMGEVGANAMVQEYAKGDDRMCRRIVSAVGQSDNPFLEDLRVGMLEDSSGSIRSLALQNLDPSDERLRGLFVDLNAGVRKSVVKHAGQMHLDMVAKMVADPDAAVRTQVFKIVAANADSFGDEKIVTAVQNAIKGEPTAAKEAALALIALKGPEAVTGLVHVVENKDIPREFRIGVLEAFEQAGGAGVPALLAAAGDDDRQIRLASLTALAEVAARDTQWPNDAAQGLLLALNGELVLPPEPEIEEEAQSVIEEEPEESEPAQVELDAVEIEEIVQEIEDSLPLVGEEIGTESTLDAIKANLPNAPIEEPDDIVLTPEQERLLSLTNTRKLGKRKVSWETGVAPHQDVQRFAARLLGSIVNPEVTKSLVHSMAQSNDKETREAVLFSLAKHGEAGGALPIDLLGPVQSLLEDPDSETRVLATRVLGWLKDDEVSPILEELLANSDQLVRVEAIHALENRGIAGDGVISALNDSYMGVGIAAARTLARLYGNDAVDALVLFAVTNDGSYRRDIGQLLGQYAPDAGAARLLELLADESQKARWLVAIDALAELFRLPPPQETLKVA